MNEYPLKISYGKPRKMLNASIDAAKKAIKNYNDTEDLFRIQNFIILMNIAYTRFFHLYFLKDLGDVYYYKKDGRYIIIDGQKKSWELSKCINEYKKKESLDNGVEENIKMFIGIRNKIEHTIVDEIELEKILFGEIQSYVLNYNKLINKYFGVDLSNLMRMPLILNLFSEEYENTVYNSLNSLFKYITEYKEKLSDEIINDDSFSFKMIAMPNIVNKRTAPAITFIRADDITEEMKTSLVANRDKIIAQEARNINLKKPKTIVGECIEELNGEGNSSQYTKHIASVILKYINVYNRDTKETNNKYCIYDVLNGEFLYTDASKELIKSTILNNSRKEINEKIRNGIYMEEGGNVNE